MKLYVLCDVVWYFLPEPWYWELISNFLGLKAATIDGQHKMKDAKLTGYALILPKAAFIFHFNFNTYGIIFYWFEQVLMNVVGIANKCHIIAPMLFCLEIIS